VSRSARRSTTPSSRSAAPSRSGREAEDLVEAFLRRRGFAILARNVAFPGVGELDIVAQQGGVVCFVEVRSRSTARFGSPAETVGARKQAQVKKVAAYYMARRRVELPARFDVASVVWNGDAGTVDYIENAFC
jgi:putative endonuclease